MPADDYAPLPEFREWSIAAVRLLQGVVYSDDAEAWNLLLNSRMRLDDYFARLGLLLVVDEPDGFAFLRQPSEEELPDGYDRLPKLFRKTRLGYDATLLCVVLRDELRRFEDEDLHNERCVVAAGDLFERWKLFFPSQQDEVRLRKALDAALRTLDDLKFVRRITAEPEEWEVRRILKARLPAAELEKIREQLLVAAQRRAGSESTRQAHDGPL